MEIIVKNVSLQNLISQYKKPQNGSTAPMLRQEVQKLTDMTTEELKSFASIAVATVPRVKSASDARPGVKVLNAPATIKAVENKLTYSYILPIEYRTDEVSMELAREEYAERLADAEITKDTYLVLEELGVAFSDMRPGDTKRLEMTHRAFEESFLLDPRIKHKRWQVISVDGESFTQEEAEKSYEATQGDVEVPAEDNKLGSEILAFIDDFTKNALFQRAQELGFEGSTTSSKDEVKKFIINYYKN